MALTAALAAAVAMVAAASSLGLPTLWVALALLPGTALVAARPDRRPIGPGRDTRTLMWTVGFLALTAYLAQPSPDQYPQMARIVLWVSVAFSVLWPSPVVVRFCLLAAAGSLVVAPGPVADLVPAAAALAAGTAVALVALNRLSPTTGPGDSTRTASGVRASGASRTAGTAGVSGGVGAGRPGGGGGATRAADDGRSTGAGGVRASGGGRSGGAGGGGGAAGLGGVRRRVGGEALVLLVVAGLIGLAMAALLPPPDGGGGGRDNAGRPPGPRPPAGDAPPYLELTDVLDAGGAGTGTGDEVVFRVEARSRALWRTMTFDRYDGRSWRLSADLDPRAFEQAQFRDVTVPPGIGEAPGSPGRDLDQRVTVETARMGLVPAAAQVRRLSLAGAAAAGPDGTVAALPPLGRGATYQARSRQAPNTPESLRPHDATVDGVPPEVGRLYLGFPGLPTRVVELAAEIAAGAPTQYDRTEAVIAWLRDNTTVRNDTGALPPGEDPLDAFLFGDRAGSAQQAATAAAVMLRSLSAPARIAVGYLPGDRGRFGGPFTVREGHAHAWVEVWFPAVGWVPFDPAGRFDAPAVTDGPSWARLVWWLLAALAVSALAWLAWRWRARRRRLQARPWSTRTYERLTRAGGRHGRPHQPAETPSEYCHALAGRLAEPRLVGVGELVTSAAWSGREPPAEARARAEAVVAAVEQSAPRRPRRGPKALVTPVRRRA